jgi:hypothetical protein
MQDRDLSAVLNAELGDESLYRFAPGSRAVAGSPAVLAHESYSIAVHLNADGYRLSFWRTGRELAHGWASSVSSVVGAAVLWAEGSGLERLSAAYPFVKFSELQLAYEQGRAKEVQWRIVLESASAGYRELVDLASKDKFLGELFPQLGHRFTLSENENSDHALASVFLARPEWFVIFRPDGEGFEFEGGVGVVISYLLSKLA